MRYSIVLVILLFFVGCGNPKIDATTDETLKDSIAKVRMKLSDEDKERFDKAVQILAFKKIDFKEIMAGNTNNFIARAKESLHGKTGQQVLEEVDLLNKQREQKTREQDLAKIKELEQQQIDAKEEMEGLKGFEVLSSYYYKEAEKYGSDQPKLNVWVKNNTEYAVSRVYAIGTIYSSDRSVPWLVEDFNFSISGGLEPGEDGQYTLSPNKFSKWGTVDAPKEAKFKVEIAKIDGSDGKVLYPEITFTEEDAATLADLKKKYGM